MGCGKERFSLLQGAKAKSRSNKVKKRDTFTTRVTSVVACTACRAACTRYTTRLRSGSRPVARPRLSAHLHHTLGSDLTIRSGGVVFDTLQSLVMRRDHRTSHNICSPYTLRNFRSSDRAPTFAAISDHLTSTAYSPCVMLSRSSASGHGPLSHSSHHIVCTSPSHAHHLISTLDICELESTGCSEEAQSG